MLCVAILQLILWNVLHAKTDHTCIRVNVTPTVLLPLIQLKHLLMYAILVLLTVYTALLQDALIALVVLLCQMVNAHHLVLRDTIFQLLEELRPASLVGPIVKFVLQDLSVQPALNHPLCQVGLAQDAFQDITTIAT